MKSEKTRFAWSTEIMMNIMRIMSIELGWFMVITEEISCDQLNGAGQK